MPDPKNFEDALYAILSGTTAIAARVSTRIYPDQAPETFAGEYIVYQLVYGESDQTHGSADSLSTQRFQIDCLALSSTAAKVLAKLVRKALHGYHGTVGSLRIDFINAFDGPSGFSETTKVYRRIVEIVATFEEPAV